MSVMRNTLNAVRYDWLGVRIGGPGASMRGLWPVLIVAMLVVFGCFFVIGRASTGPGAPAEATSAAPAAHAAIPRGLRGGSPIAGKVPSAVSPPPRRTAAPVVSTAAAPQTATAAQPLPGEGQSATAPSAPAAAAPQPAQARTPRGGESEAAGARGSVAPSGGSFDSSQ